MVTRPGTERKFLGWDASDAVGGLLLIGLPAAIPVAAWLMGWRTAAVVLGIIAGLWLLVVFLLWYAMSYEGRQHAKMARQSQRMQEERDRTPIADRKRPD